MGRTEEEMNIRVLSIYMFMLDPEALERMGYREGTRVQFVGQADWDELTPLSISRLMLEYLIHGPTGEDSVCTDD